MRIAIYSGGIPSTSFVENLIAEMAKKRYHISLFGTKNSKYTVANKNVKVYTYPSNYFSLFFKLMWNTSRLLITHPDRLISAVKEIKKVNGISIKLNRLCRFTIVLNHLPDIFHVQWIKTGHEWLFLKDFGVKVVGSFRGAQINYSPIANDKLAQIYKDTFPLYDGFHAVSEAIMNEALKYNASVDKIWRITGAVHPDLLIYPSLKKQKIKRTKLQVLSVGRSHWIKGYSYAIDACKILMDDGVSFHYTIIGASDSEELLFQINDLNLNEFVTLTDKVEQKEVIKQYENSDILLLPSLKEGIANVVLEAMAVGLPVISTDCGGMNEVIINEKNGWLVPTRDSLAIANAIMHFTKLNDDTILTIVDNAKGTIKKDFLLDTQIDKMIQMYKGIITQGYRF